MQLCRLIDSELVDSFKEVNINSSQLCDVRLFFLGDKYTDQLRCSLH